MLTTDVIAIWLTAAVIYVGLPLFVLATILMAIGKLLLWIWR